MAANRQIILINAATITTTGAATAALADLPGHNRWAATIGVGTVTGTNPTLDVKVQHSHDGSNWLDLATFTQVTGSSAQEVKFAAAATDYLKPLLPYVRASYTVGGTASPTFNTVTVKLLLDK